MTLNPAKNYRELDTR